MHLSHAAIVLGLGALGLLLASTASRGETSEMRSELTADDSTGARLLVERQDGMLRIQAAFINDNPVGGRDRLTGADTLTYELDVRRTGEAGTSQSTQSGRFETAPGQTDTLSTVRINVQPGDRAELHLAIRRGEILVDEVRQQRTF